MTHFIAIIIVGAIIGSIGAGFTHRDLRAGCGGNIVAGLIGSWIGTRFLGDWAGTLPASPSSRPLSARWSSCCSLRYSSVRNGGIN